MTRVLDARGIRKSFGGLAAVQDVDLHVDAGEIVGLIGPNGSGKTTLFDCLSRLHRIDAGQVTFKGADVTHAPPWRMARLGLARTFQVLRIYRQMTVMENMLISRRWGAFPLLELLRASPARLRETARELLAFLLLDRHVDTPAGHLSGGQRRLLEIGMAMMSEPDLLLLDEATSGVNPTLIRTIVDTLRRLNAERGVALLLIEHNIEFISELCSRVVVLDRGRQLAEGTPEQIRRDEAVIEAYFGA